MYLSWSSCTSMSFKSLEKKIIKSMHFQKSWNRGGAVLHSVMCAESALVSVVLRMRHIQKPTLFGVSDMLPCIQLCCRASDTQIKKTCLKGIKFIQMVLE